MACGSGLAGVWTTTSRANSPISRSVPAFIRIEPPTVAGIPARASTPTPPRPATFEHRAAREALPPASATTTSFSVWTSRVVKLPSRRRTIPRIPPSPTSRFEPAPRTNMGRRRLKTRRRTKASSSVVWTSTSASAGPPIFHQVTGARGSSKRARSVKRSRSASRSVSSRAGTDFMAGCRGRWWRTLRRAQGDNGGRGGSPAI